MNKNVETIIKTEQASSFENNDVINGTLILTNIRIYLEIDAEQKLYEILLKDIKKVTIGGLNVLRIELVNNTRYNFLVEHLFSWLKTVKKAKKDFLKKSQDNENF